MVPRMLLAITPFTSGSRFVGLLHVASVVAAFGPVLVYPTLRKAGDAASIARLHMRLVMPAMFLMWVFGMGLAGLSKPDGADEPVYKVSETWLALAVVDWVILMAVGWFLIRPSITDRSDSANTRFSAGVGVTHLGLVVGLALMIWKPGA
jgi:ABC-type branched-subunit amino acid transport system permease subunit